MKPPIAICLAVLISSGCGALLQGGTETLPPIESKVLSEQRFAVVAEPNAVDIFKRKDQLPKGLFFYQDRKDGQARTKLFASPTYPSEAEPHVVLSAMATTKPVRTSSGKKALEEEYRRRASEMGANALYFASNPGVVFAIRLSRAELSDERKGVAEMEKSERRTLEGYKSLGAPLKVELGRAELVLPTKKARCYAMTVVMEEGAMLNQQASHALFVAVKSGDRLLGNRSLQGPVEEIANPDGLEIKAPRHGSYLHMRSFSNTLGCTNGEGGANVRFWTSGNSSNIGNGAVQIQIYEKKITNAKLASMVKENDANFEKARVAAVQQRARQDREDQARREREAQERSKREAREASRPSATPSPASTYFSMSLKSECSRTVKLFLGKKPRYGSGETRTISSNSINSFTGTAGKMFWIVDGSGNGVSSYMASVGSQNIRILPSCAGFAPR